MALTQPIRDKKHLRQLAEHFLQKGQRRNHLLLVVCAHTALRISDILKLEWQDVYDEEHEVYKSHITITEGKTGKTKTVALHPQIMKALKLYLPHRRGSFLFGSSRGSAAISRVQAWRILHLAGMALGLSEKVNCHGLRKVWGYWAWKSGVSPVLVIDVYNHSSYEVTRRYLGISQDDTDRAYLAVQLF